ncbi:MAG: 4-(cytidine 5'-diphospho)-2-C-methyl-D-erythritol kinase, partial [Acidimicrobiales bacterium]
QARAKINLTLHVGPPIGDGYHPLKSLVVFADIWDVVEMRPAQGDKSTLVIEGPFANGLASDKTNLVLKTAQLISDKKFDLKLIKNLPIASGIGGGSADAAATARLVAPENIDQISTDLMAIGADIPVCLRSKTCLMEGKGEQLTPLPNLGSINAVLVNPGVAVSTGEIFKLFDQTKPTSANLAVELPNTTDLMELAKWGRNDLQDVAISIAPEVQTVLDALSEIETCQLARMSGSGATCFGLFSSRDQAVDACAGIKDENPDWWSVATVLGDTV